MSDKDKEWLTEALKQFVFKESDRLKEISELFQKDIDSNFKHVEGISKEDNDLENRTYPKTFDLIDECQAFMETHERNKYNLAKLGGLNQILHYILNHPNGKVREIACSTFSQTV